MHAILRTLVVTLEEAHAFIGAIGATVRHGGDQAFYSPASDTITLPAFEQFDAPEHYYGTSLHEHGHWTGAKHRRDREFGKRFGDQAYALEELVAELASAFLCAELEIGGNCGIPNTCRIGCGYCDRTRRRFSVRARCVL